MAENILEIRDLVASFRAETGILRAVDQLSLKLCKGQTLGLVGESGCGKSVTALSIMRLLDSPPGVIESGTVLFEGRSLLSLSEEDMRKVRGNKISMIFQEPMTSLNPVFTVGDQIAEVFRIHQGLSKRQALKKALEMLELVRIPAAASRIHEYPHQLSGGMRQRIMIAIALACRPALLIADEPTTALDVTIQAQILALINQLQAELDMAILMITHDLGVVAQACDHVVVMYAGKAVEAGTAEDIFTNPLHPYTKGLLGAVPRPGQKGSRLETIKGTVPSLLNRPQGCRFNNRCPEATDLCRQKTPPEFFPGKSHGVACWLYREGATRP